VSLPSDSPYYSIKNQTLSQYKFQKYSNYNFVGLNLGYSIPHFQKILKLSGMAAKD
jgi:hypothetical protein